MQVNVTRKISIKKRVFFIKPVELKIRFYCYLFEETSETTKHGNHEKTWVQCAMQKLRVASYGHLSGSTYNILH